MIYLDYAAATPVRREVKEAMEPYFEDFAGNASSIHAYGRKARSAIHEARRELSLFVGCSSDEIVFTSGGTESIHAAIFGAWLAQQQKRHIVTTAIEHHAVLHTLTLLEELGVEVTVVETDSRGQVSTDDVLRAIRSDTLLVSVMSVNNELGTIEPIGELVRAVKNAHPKVLFHSDMVQALPAKRIDLRDVPVDFASFSAHKVHGPKGVGALFIRKGTPWRSTLRGGSQERERRAGTENVPAIVGFGAAVKWLDANWEDHETVIRSRSRQLREGLLLVPGVSLNSPTDGAPHITNVRFIGVRADRLLMRLDLEGIAVSAGSACTAGSLEPSHVLMACGFDEVSVRESVRFSVGDRTTEAEIQETLTTVARVVSQLRNVVP